MRRLEWEETGLGVVRGRSAQKDRQWPEGHKICDEGIVSRTLTSQEGSILTLRAVVAQWQPLRGRICQHLTKCPNNLPLASTFWLLLLDLPLKIYPCNINSIRTWLFMTALQGITKDNKQPIRNNCKYIHTRENYLFIKTQYGKSLWDKNMNISIWFCLQKKHGTNQRLLKIPPYGEGCGWARWKRICLGVRPPWEDILIESWPWTMYILHLSKIWHRQSTSPCSGLSAASCCLPHFTNTFHKPRLPCHFLRHDLLLHLAFLQMHTFS